MAGLLTSSPAISRSVSVICGRRKFSAGSSCQPRGRGASTAGAVRCRAEEAGCWQAGAVPLRRQVLEAMAALALPFGATDTALAILPNRRAMREKLVPEEEYKELPNGLRVYDIKIGGGRLAEIGDRVTVHYVVKWKGVTFMTSRQGLGVTGGTPYGFDLGSSDRGYVLKGLDLAVQGMRVGGQREVIVPPGLAYGSKGLQEIPPDATLNLNVELLSIKESPFGYQVKLVEG